LVLTVLEWKGLKLPEVGFIAGLVIGGGLMLYGVVSLFFPVAKAQKPVQRVIEPSQRVSHDESFFAADAWAKEQFRRRAYESGRQEALERRRQDDPS